MKNAPKEVHEHVVSYFKNESLGNRYDTSAIEAFVGGDKEIGDGHLFLVMAKEKSSDGYGCWTCWNDSVKSLNYGHYDLKNREEAIEILEKFEPKLKGEVGYVVKDLNDYEEPQFFSNLTQFKDWAGNMLQEYFEANSDYGNPIASIFKYVPKESISELIGEYSYETTQETYQDFLVELEEFNNREVEL